MRSDGGNVDGGDTAGPEDYGELERRDGRAAIRFRRHLRHPQQKVWRALVEPDHLATWFPTTIEGERRAGAPLRYQFRHDEGEPFDGDMLQFEPPRLMELRWDDETLRFELQPHDDGTELVVTVTFDELGKAARDGAGWHACLDLLDCSIDGRTAPWSSADRWREVKDAYIGRFGPDASTVGPPEDWERVHGSEDRSETDRST